jgi:hypothetical protein
MRLSKAGKATAGRTEAFSPAEENPRMKRQTTGLDPTLLEVAEILGIEPDQALHWIIEGRLLVTRQDTQTVIMLESHRQRRSPREGNLLIFKKKPGNRKNSAFSC